MTVSTKKTVATVALLISDLHLQEAHPHTMQAFLDFLQTHARHTQQLYLLGDLFEYWAGDDDLETPFNQHIASAIREVSDSGVKVFWIAGNRDFLVGEVFAKEAGLTLLPDPYVITIAGRRITLAHGDAQCTDDVAYMAFRAQVRQPAFQQHFLSKSLTERKAFIAGARKESQAEQKHKTMEIMDVNAQAIADLFTTTNTDTLIHGHTHRPALHHYPDSSRRRYVLPDWEYEGEDNAIKRGGWIAIDNDAVIRRFGYDGQEINE